MSKAYRGVYVPSRLAFATAVSQAEVDASIVDGRIVAFHVDTAGNTRFLIEYETRVHPEPPFRG